MISVDELLAHARARLVRLTATQAWSASRDGAFLVDIRPEFQRRTDGGLPGALPIERVHLEWRCDPASPARVPDATGYDVRWIIICDEGYASSLAAASLQGLGLRHATDVIDGFRAWRWAGLSISRPAVPTMPRLP